MGTKAITTLFLLLLPSIGFTQTEVQLPVPYEEISLEQFCQLANTQLGKYVDKAEQPTVQDIPTIAAIHNTMIIYSKEVYGKDNCIDDAILEGYYIWIKNFILMRFSNLKAYADLIHYDKNGCWQTPFYILQ